MKNLLIILSVFISVNCFSQSQWKITKVIAIKQQTVIVEACKMGTDSLALFPVNFRGMGRKPPLIGLWLTYSKEGLTKRKIHVLLNLKP
jgi:hypothetical protein